MCMTLLKGAFKSKIFCLFFWFKRFSKILRLHSPSLRFLRPSTEITVCCFQLEATLITLFTYCQLKTKVQNVGPIQLLSKLALNVNAQAV